MKTPDPKPVVLIGLGLLVPMLAARASRRLTGRGYQIVTGREFPRNPADRNTSWREALLWGAVSGMAGGLARVGAKRMLAETPIPADGCDMEDAQEDLK